MSAFEQAASLAKQYGGNFGQELAKAAVANILGGNSNAATTEVPAKAEASIRCNLVLCNRESLRIICLQAFFSN